MPMIRAMAQIEQDICDLEQEVVAIAQELSETYDEYLIVLGDFVQRQLILSSYHLCTQGYPEQFLKLAVEQRRTLQQSLQRIARKAHEDLLHPSRLAELTHPFTSELDGIDDSDDEDATLKKLTAIVRRVMGESKNDEDDDYEDAASDSLSLSASQGDDDDQFDANDLSSLVIPDDLDDDFLNDARLTISEFSFDELTDATDEEIDWDDDLDEDFEGEDSDLEAPETADSRNETSLTGPTDSDIDEKGALSDTFDLSPDALSTDELSTDALSTDALSMSGADERVIHSSEPNTDSSSVVPPMPLATGAMGESIASIPAMLNLEIVEETPTPEPPASVPVPPTPKALAQRCDRLETQIASMLKQASGKVNMLLKKSGVLPKSLPSSVLQAAMKADLSSDMQDSPSNILNLLVETGSKQKQPKLMRVMAIRLRLAELEFNSPTLMAWRSRIRELAAQLHKLARNYKTLQQELAIAQAEAAWRSTWYELDQ
ncbi:MAG: hypothetical protein WBA57_21850 [Elainellaceae cyanobacterium]